MSHATPLDSLTLRRSPTRHTHPLSEYVGTAQHSLTAYLAERQKGSVAFG